MTPQELKNSILQLAIDGKLVKQRPEEGTAQELYEQIQAEKQRLIKEGKLKKEKPLPEITEDEKPFEIPEGWMWVRFGHITNLLSGQDLKPTDYNDKKKGIPYITGASNITDAKVIINRWTENAKAIANKGDLLLTCKGTVGKTVILQEEKVHIARQIMAITSYKADINFIRFFIERQIGALKAQAKSIIPGIERKNILLLTFPLPPLAEQKRIVAKIEELLPLVDRYEKAWTKLEEFNHRFPEDMKKSILQQAIQGKLVEQRPEEGTAQELYAQIQAEKQRLVKEGKIKKEKPLPEITEEEKPFEIPEGWMWVRWGDLSESIQYGYNAPAQSAGRIQMVRISDIQNGKVLWESVPFCDIQENEIPNYLLKKNDILFARTGGTVGKSYLVKDVPGEAIYAGYLIRTRYSEYLCPEYMKYFMESSLYWSQLKNGTIATAQPNCNGKTLSKMVLPLPPIAEQKRIVEKLEELLAMCERLKK